eukprot:TRINITY_DN5506_c0_g1_i2.p2 TRINITY_DN5506_c0_g1~~TRINITY_DN5506_c0_g1_i2.p2  ORF type:complete len:195 (+),score=32.94 TRINITY_DN5506_c0_g1_i2:148-732(+)
MCIRDRYQRRVHGVGKRKQRAILSRSMEIRRLKTKNDELLEKVKRFSRELDRKLPLISWRRHEKEVKEPLEIIESKIVNELESLQALIKVYQKEIELLHAKLKVDTGATVVIQLQKRPLYNRAEQQQLEKRAKHFKNQIKISEKELARVTSCIDKEITRIEVCFLPLNSIGGTTAQDIQQGSQQRRDVVGEKKF